MDGFRRLNASGRLSGEWDMKQICNRGCWRTGKYIIILFAQAQMFIRRHSGERRSEEPAKTLKARQHASRISIHFNSFLSAFFTGAQKAWAVPWSKLSAIQPVARYAESCEVTYTVPLYGQEPSIGGVKHGYKPSKVFQQIEPSAWGWGVVCWRRGWKERKEKDKKPHSAASVTDPRFQFIQSMHLRQLLIWRITRPETSFRARNIKMLDITDFARFFIWSAFLCPISSLTTWLVGKRWWNILILKRGSFSSLHHTKSIMLINSGNTIITYRLKTYDLYEWF